MRSFLPRPDQAAICQVSAEGGPLTVNRNGIPLIVNGREDDWPEGLTASRLTQERNYHLVFPSWVTATSYLTSLTLCPSCLLDLEAEPV